MAVDYLSLPSMISSGANPVLRFNLLFQKLFLQGFAKLPLVVLQNQQKIVFLSKGFLLQSGLKRIIYTNNFYFKS